MSWDQAIWLIFLGRHRFRTDQNHCAEELEALFGLMAESIFFVSAPEKATPHNSMMEGLRILRL
jgi:hypothetical protein